MEEALEDIAEFCRKVHAAPFRRAVEEGLLDPKRAVQVGIRGAQNTEEGWNSSVIQLCA